MPIVSGMGGNAGTQTLAVAVRAIATNQLTSSEHAPWMIHAASCGSRSRTALSLFWAY